MSKVAIYPSGKENAGKESFVTRIFERAGAFVKKNMEFLGSLAAMMGALGIVNDVAPKASTIAFVGGFAVATADVLRCEYHRSKKEKGSFARRVDYAVDAMKNGKESAIFQRIKSFATKRSSFAQMARGQGGR